MARRVIDIGVQGNDGTGDSIRESFRKVNENFVELYAIFNQGDTISFTDLDDVPDELGSYKIPMSSAEGDFIEMRSLVEGTGIAIDYENEDGEIIISSTSSEVSSDPSPTLGGPLNANLQGVANTIDFNDITAINNAVISFNATHGTNITADSLVINRGYADSRYINVAGDTMTGALNVPAGASGTQVPRVSEVVKKAGDTMTGVLTLSDHPGTLAGVGIINGDDDLQAATKLYVDNSSFSSATNLFVATSGQDDPDPPYPEGKEGRAFAYAFGTVNRAAQKAEEVIYYNRARPGPYKQTITYTNNDVAISSIISTVSLTTTQSLGYIEASDILYSNIEFIQKEVIEHINTEYQDLVYNEELCERDVGLIVQAILLDLRIGGNYQTVNAGLSYRRNASARFASSTQLEETAAGIAYAQTVANVILSETLSYEPLQGVVAIQYPSDLGFAIPNSSIRNNVSEQFNDIIDILNTGLSAAPTVDTGNGTYLVQFSNGGNSSVDQGIAANRDIIAGKILRGQTSGATGKIVSYTADYDPGIDDLIEVQLLQPIEFEVGETLEYAESINQSEITIRVESGSYEEDYPIRIPANVSLKGDEFRRVLIRPKDRPSQSPWRGLFFRRNIEHDGIDNVLTRSGYDIQPVTINLTTDRLTAITAIKAGVGIRIRSTGSLPTPLTTDAVTSAGITLTKVLYVRDVVGLTFKLSDTPEGTAFDLTGLNSGIHTLIPEPLNTLGATCAISISAITKGVSTIVTTGSAHNLKDGDRITFADVGGMTQLNGNTYYAKASTLGTTQFELHDAEKLISTSRVDSTAYGVYTPSTGYVKAFIEYGYHYLTDPRLALSNTNPALNNKLIDVFLMNDATIIRNVTAQGHGGFMMVLDPEGQILHKSPYCQTGTSFSQSTHTHRFAGGQYIDGFTGRLGATVTLSGSFTGPFRIGLSGLPRNINSPTSFFYNGFRYQINAVIRYSSNTAFVVLDDTTPWVENPTFGLLSPLLPGGIRVIIETAGYRSMLANDFTQVNDLGYGIVATNNGYTEQVSTFCYYNQISYLSENGGQIRSVAGSNCNGVYALVARGRDPNEVPDVVALAQSFVQVARVYKSGLLTDGDISDTLFYIRNYSYVPFNQSEVEIDHGSSIGIVKYTISSASGTGEIAAADQVGPITILTADNTNPVRITTTTPHGFSSGWLVNISGVSSMIQINDRSYYVKYINATQFDLYSQRTLKSDYSIDGTGYLDGTGGSASAGPEILKVNLAASIIAGASSGLFDDVNNNQTIIIRAQTQFSLTGVTEVSPTRPSTALVFDNQTDQTLRTIAFSTSSPGNGGLWSDLTQTSVTVREAYSYVSLALDYNNLAVVDPTNASKKLGSQSSDTKIAVNIGESPSQTLLDKLNSGDYAFGWYGKIHRIDSVTQAANDPASVKYINSPAGAITKSVALREINGITNSSVVEITTSVAHTYTDGTRVRIFGLPIASMYALNNTVGYTKSTGPNTFELYSDSGLTLGIDTSNTTVYSAYTTGGKIESPTRIRTNTNHGYSDGTRIYITNVGGMVQLNGQTLYAKVIDADEFELYEDADLLNPLDTSLYNNYSGVGGTIVISNPSYISISTISEIYSPASAAGLYSGFDSGIAYSIQAGLQAGSTGEISVNISTTRVTSHDFLDIGTGGVNDTNYPRQIYGDPVNQPTQANEVVEEGEGRVFYSSTDQDGNFKVGEFFKVDQGTGTVQISGSISLGRLAGIQLLRGDEVKEFSNDSSMTNADTDTVPTESAVVGYVNKRLGLTEASAPVTGPIGPGFLALDNSNQPSSNISWGGYKITNLLNPTDALDAVNKDYVDTQLSLQNELSELQDIVINEPYLDAQLLASKQVPGGLEWHNVTVTGDLNLEYDSTANSIVANLSLGSIGNAQIANDAAIAQSKLSLSNSTSATTAGAATKGIASFNSANFTVVDGWVSITSTGLASLGNIAATSVLGNSNSSSASVSEVTMKTVVEKGVATAFSGSGLLQKTVNPLDPTDITYSTTSVTSTGVAGALIQTEAASGAPTLTTMQGGGGIDIKYLKLDTYRVMDTGTFTIFSGTAIEQTALVTRLFTPAGQQYEGAHFISATGGSDSSLPLIELHGNFNLPDDGSTLVSTYGDLSEYYEADQEYESGTVLIFGGNKEITTTTTLADSRVAGIVSTASSFQMNGDCPGTKVLLALTGRVPCKFIGTISKGDMVCTSSTPGYACRADNPAFGTIIGKSLVDKTTLEPGVIEVAVGRL